MIRVGYSIKGIVQGVGFRPFIYRLACQNKLKGFVLNNAEGVEVELEGSTQNIELFEKLLHSELPPLARIDSIEKQELPLKHDTSFEIHESELSQSKTTLISPDIATCQDCLDDLQNRDKYKNYFATNCTNCGPRYSIIKTVPYDRANTSMANFGMCDSCDDEYHDPLNRRYHAQPVSCNLCGPKLDGSIEEFAQHIKDGKIVAIKGMGGFHIMCDATNDEAVARLRQHKNRPTKPLALMCKDVEMIETLACVSEQERELLVSKEAPIVVMQKADNAKMSELIAPNIQRVGCMLAYTPLHHMLFWHVDTPVVATSANLADEPIITTKEDVLEKLPFVEHVLDFNREIINGVDDSLVQVVHGKLQTLRLGRGYAPKVIKLKEKSKKNILAVGANAKNAIALVMEDNIIISPHIGDLDSFKAFSYFERTIETFKRFYDFEPDVIVHDKHPNYLTTKWAKQAYALSHSETFPRNEQDKELVEVGHHNAHILACKAEFGLEDEYLGFSFDGTGYGDDGTLWGGEVFVGDERKYHFKSIKLLGAAKAIKEPRRVALSMLFDTYTLEEVKALELACVEAFSESELHLLHQSHVKNLNAPQSSSVGRLFDAVASFAGLCQFISYEGESGLLVESMYDASIRENMNYEINDGEINIDLLAYTHLHAKTFCTMFFNTLRDIVIEIAKKEKLEVILSGGVFQNKTLLELLACSLEKEDITYHHQQSTAINDGGIALGQAYSLIK